MSMSGKIIAGSFPPNSRVRRFIADVATIDFPVSIDPVSEIFGIFGGYIISVFDAGLPGASYIQQTLKAINYVDFFSGFIKTMFFAVFISWICCYQGFTTKGGSLGVGKFTTRAVALSYVTVVISNTILTKIILNFWG